jgi:hypothetical protein
MRWVCDHFGKSIFEVNDEEKDRDCENYIYIHPDCTSVLIQTFSGHSTGPYGDGTWVSKHKNIARYLPSLRARTEERT